MLVNKYLVLHSGDYMFLNRVSLNPKHIKEVTIAMNDDLPLHIKHLDANIREAASHIELVPMAKDNS